MGFLTTVTFYNDDIDSLKKNPKELAETLHLACCGERIDRGYKTDFVGNLEIILQKPRHSDDTTLYLHAGNTVTDINNAESEWAIKQFLSDMKYHTKRLKEKLKELKIES